MVRRRASLLLLLVVVAVLAACNDAVHGQTLETTVLATYLLDEEGTLFAWGNAREILGVHNDTVYGKAIGDAPGEMASGLPQLQSDELANVTTVAGGSTCLVDATAPPSRAVQCWGHCNKGVCGHARAGTYFVSIADAPLTDLGSDDTDSVISVQGSSLGSACALFSSGRVKCWGRNAQGQLGLGDTEDRGDGPNDMGDNLPFVDLGTGVKAVELAASAWNTCVVLEGRTQVKCWGMNDFGQLGLGDTKDRGAEPGDMGNNLTAIDMGAEIERIQVGQGIVCVLIAVTREVKCWGRNRRGSLGAAHDNDVTLANATLPAVSVGGRVAKLSAGTWHTCVILEDAARVKCWGYNRVGQLGLDLDLDRVDTHGTPPSELPDVAYGVTGEIAVEISAAGFHSCVRLANGVVRCWGFNSHGQLGHSADYPMWGKAPNQMGANLPDSPYRPTQRPTPSPTASPVPPTPEPSSSPSSSPTLRPSASPSARPTASPTGATASPTPSPTAAGGSGLGIGLGIGAAVVVALAGVAAYVRFGRSSAAESKNQHTRTCHCVRKNPGADLYLHRGASR